MKTIFTILFIIFIQQPKKENIVFWNNYTDVKKFCPKIEKVEGAMYLRLNDKNVWPGNMIVRIIDKSDTTYIIRNQSDFK